MSCVCILTPVVVAAWPALSAAVGAAATALGYRVMAEASRPARGVAQYESTSKGLVLDMPHTEAVTDALSRDQRIVVTRDDVSITFARDARGRTTLHVTGAHHSEAELRRLGEELAGSVVQHYVHEKLRNEIASLGYTLAEEETDEQGRIRLKVRQWET